MSANPKLDQQPAQRPPLRRVVKADPRYVAIIRNVISADPPVSENRARAIGFTSARSGEGTTTVATNFALSASALNLGRVLLVDANEKRPRLHRLFNHDNSIGLQTALDDKCQPLECLLPTGIDRLTLVCQGPPPPGGVTVFGLASIEQLLNQWRGTFSWIVFDLPPADSMSNCGFLAARLDAALLVVEAGRLQRQIAERASNYLRGNGAHLLGAVFDKVPRRQTKSPW